MDKAVQIDAFNRFTQVSRETIISLKKYENMLIEANKSLNLVGKSTIKEIWYRHFLDSVQVIDFIDKNDKSLIDIGSGAGFPGLILAFYVENSKFHVKLYEKSSVKRDFLRNLKQDLDIKNVSIENNVYEKEILADVIVCRAFKKLDEILRISREIVKKPHKLIILKGKNAQSEINNVSLDSNYSYKLEKSITDDDSKIIIVEVK